jgi:hypothetical protein
MTTTTPARSIPWPRIVAEGVAITTSILLAFAIDAWWDGYQRRGEELTALSVVRNELEATQEIIANDIAGLDRSAAAAADLMSHGGSRRYEISAQRVDTLLAVAIDSPSFNPVVPTLEALLTSDGLAVISDLRLRAVLARWPRIVAAIQRNEAQNQTHFQNRFWPYLQERMPVRRLDFISNPEFGGPMSAFSVDSRELLAEMQFENHLDDIYFYATLRSQRLSDLRSLVAEALDILAGA